MGKREHKPITVWHLTLKVGNENHYYGSLTALLMDNRNLMKPDSHFIKYDFDEKEYDCALFTIRKDKMYSTGLIKNKNNTQ